ncbi:T9SS type A sorting domain-containing protein [Dyadobacter sandarakinus]|uniref:T9SS type A sorting domain-containing protein n=1 Tax=Dyadobacter sandarakinus TaxID=2747268 RepID=A0ABX7I689_9BACT|nr:T9SS type A sorting domain-containing protein [Dyadobacter sandarakinus]QRR01300.1 T9SS type A sorting domain-containing protein [Dyadobacter sandarakinus]
MRKLLLNLTILCLGLPACLFAQPVIQWDKTIGTLQGVMPETMEQTTDGGYILVGTSDADAGGDKSESSKGSSDFWIVKLAPNGAKQWDKVIGGPGTETAAAIRQTMDGGYIVGGTSSSPIGGDKSEKSKGGTDYWIVKLDQTGNLLWDKTIGGNSSDGLVDLRQTPDGGYVLAGSTLSDAGSDKSEPKLGSLSPDFWVVKVSGTGTIVWDRTLGTPSWDNMRCMTLTSDGGIVVAGEQGYQEQSSGYYLLKISAQGVQEWERNVAGIIYGEGLVDGWANIGDLQQTPDGGFILGGTCTGGVGGDRSEYSIGDYWIVKLNADLTVAWDNVIATSAGGDGKYINYYAGLTQVPGGGYLVLGYSASHAGADKSEDSHNAIEDFWLIKLNAAGIVVWDKTIGGASVERAVSIVNTADGGFVLMGSSNSDIGFEKTEDAKGVSDFWVVKFGSEEPPLPVTLTGFFARKENATVILSWQTTSETSSDFFEIQHSTDGKSWNAVQKVFAKYESTATEEYMYVHASPPAGENYYRLKIVDTDGVSAFSKITSLRFNAEFTVRVYPNPAAETLTIEVADPQDVKMVQLLDSREREHYQSPEAGKSIDVRSFTPGVYFAKITRKDGGVAAKKIIINN